MFKLSLMQAICDLMRNPPASAVTQPSWSKPWTVLLTDDMRQGVKATWPYVYLTGISNRDAPLRSPCLVADISAPMPHVALGVGEVNNLSKVITLGVHCIGRNSGESEDMGSYLAELLRSVPVLDFNNPLTPGTWPPVDTRPAVNGTLPPYYFPTIQTMAIDPAVQQGTIKPTAKQALQGQMLGSELVVFKFVSSF